MLHEEVAMTEMTKQELLDAADRLLARTRTESPAEAIAALKQTGILDEDGILSERYGGPGKMTPPPSELQGEHRHQ